MNVFNLFRHPGSAPVARERLQILLSHERAHRGQGNMLGALQEEILTAIAKHVAVEGENVQVKMDRGATVSTLEINVEIPHSTDMTIRAIGPSGSIRRPRASRWHA